MDQEAIKKYEDAEKQLTEAPAPVESLVGQQVLILQGLATKAMNSPEDGLNFMEAARNFFMGHSSKLRAALMDPDAQARVDALPTEMAVMQLTANYIAQVTQSGDFPHVIITFYNAATDSISGVSSHKTKEDILLNIQILEAYCRSLANVYAQAQRQKLN